MAQLPEDELKQFDHTNGNGHASKPNQHNKNGFLCSRCDEYHDISDIFLWSKCRHQYSRGCVTFTIRQQLYDEEYPSCIVGGCGQMLSPKDAELVLNEEIMYQFYNIHNMYYPQQIDDEKQQQNGQSPASLYQSLAPKLNLDDSDSDDYNVFI